MKQDLFPTTRNRGFTLIEVMITVAIVAMLAAIALPSYNEYVRRGHRAEAKNTLQAIAQRLEQNYTLSGSYALTQGAVAINNASIAAWGMDSTPTTGGIRYNMTFGAGEPTTTTFVLQATPAGSQVGDTCGVLMMDHRNLKGAGGVLNNRVQLTRDCWDR
jgi:type IV pilus assembly protein PilE